MTVLTFAVHEVPKTGHGGLRTSRWRKSLAVEGEPQLVRNGVSRIAFWALSATARSLAVRLGYGHFETRSFADAPSAVTDDLGIVADWIACSGIALRTYDPLL